MKNRKKFIRYLLITLGVLLIIVIVGKQAGWIGKKDETKVSTEFVSKKDYY